MGPDDARWYCGILGPQPTNIGIRVPKIESRRIEDGWSNR